MAYFLILPAFIVWLVVAAIALAVIRTNDRLADALPYAWRFCLWATIGFIIANLLLVVVVAGAVVLLGDSPQERTLARDALTMLVGVGGIVGPIPASIFGWLGGGLLGSFRTFRAQRRTVV